MLSGNEVRRDGARRQLEESVFLFEIGLSIDSAADFGDGGCLLVALYLFRFELQSLKPRVARMLAEIFFADSESLGNVEVRE